MRVVLLVHSSCPLCPPSSCPVCEMRVCEFVVSVVCVWPQFERVEIFTTHPVALYTVTHSHSHWTRKEWTRSKSTGT